MIGFDALGRLGWLGNQMFQYAALRGIAARHGYGFRVPASPHGRRRRGEHELFHTFEMGAVGPENIGTMGAAAPVRELVVLGYDEAFAAGCPDGVSLAGFFQAEAWFADIADDIRADFAFLPHYAEPAAEYRAALGGRAIALHVRRGDYVGQQDRYRVLDAGWYADALARLDPNAMVLVFSDDPAWCQAQPLFAGERFLIAASRDHRHDLCLMSLCDDFVIANSTYSWWGAWLGTAPDKRVVLPAHWFGPAFADKDARGMFVAGWEAV